MESLSTSPPPPKKPKLLTAPILDMGAVKSFETWAISMKFTREVFWTQFRLHLAKGHSPPQKNEYKKLKPEKLAGRISKM